MFRELVRKNKALPREECIALLQQEKRGVLSVLGDNDYPYGMPMNHFYNEEDGCIYFHSGNVGHRLEALRRHDKVSFCCFDEGKKEDGEWFYLVRSVIAFGRMEFVEDEQEIIDISIKLSHKFTLDDEYIKGAIERSLHRTVMTRLRIEDLQGKLVTEK